MGVTSAVDRVLLIALLAIPVVASAQDVTGDQEPRALYNPVISADGAWMAAERRDETGVDICSLDSDVTFTIERGRNPRICGNSRWVSALQRPLEEPETARAGRTLILLDTQTGERRTFEHVLSYDVTHFASHVAYLQSPEAEADRGHNAEVLHVAELVGDRVFTWQNVTHFDAHQMTGPGVRGTWKEDYAYVAFVTRNEEGSDRLEIAFVSHAKKGWGTGGTFQGSKIAGLCWARDSITLGFLNSAETTDESGSLRVSTELYTWHDVRDQPGHRRFTRVR